MKRLVKFTILALATAANAQTKDQASTTVPYSRALTHDKAESWTYFKPGLDLRRYETITVDPTVVYQGSDAQFDDITPEDREKYAQIVTTELRQTLAKSFPASAGTKQKTARLRITLLGVDKTTGGVATATRVTPFGFAVNAVKSMAGKPGRLTGSILYGAELTDASTGELQVGAVRRQSPDALDIPATFSTSDTVKAVAHDIAEDIRQKLLKATGRAN